MKSCDAADMKDIGTPYGCSETQRHGDFPMTGSETNDLLDRQDSVRAVFQPIVDLRTGMPRGYEALARFDTEGSVEQHFTLAHRQGLGHALEARAIQTALRAGRPPAGQTIGLNVSPSALFSVEVDSVLPRRLEGILIEVTEHELVTGGERLLARLDELRARGARLAIDDVGAGYAGFQQLVRLMPDVVKLDRELITGIDASPVKAALVDAFVRFARGINADVCAEGIETAAELRILADLDVTCGQGFFLARPSAPWAPVSDAASEACGAGLARALGVGGLSSAPGRTGPVLERLAAKLAHCANPADAVHCLIEVSGILGAQSVALSRLVGTGLNQRLVTWASDDQCDSESYPVAAFPETARILKTGEAAIVSRADPSADPAEAALLEELGAESGLMVPLIALGEPVGLLEVFTADDGPFSRERITIARTIAHQLAMMMQAAEDRWSAAATQPQRAHAAASVGYLATVPRNPAPQIPELATRPRRSFRLG